MAWPIVLHVYPHSTQTHPFHNLYRLGLGSLSTLTQSLTVTAVYEICILQSLLIASTFNRHLTLPSKISIYLQNPSSSQTINPSLYIMGKMCFIEMLPCGDKTAQLIIMGKLGDVLWAKTYGVQTSPLPKKALNLRDCSFSMRDNKNLLNCFSAQCCHPTQPSKHSYRCSCT